MGISLAQYRAMLNASPTRKGGGRVLRLPAGTDPSILNRSGLPSTKVPRKDMTSAERARDRVRIAIASLEQAKVDVVYDAEKRIARICLAGASTLPPNRVINMAREQSSRSQKTFSAYKHASAARMRDAALLLRSIKKTPLGQVCKVHVDYERVVTSEAKLIDVDAIAFSFKYLLDGLVHAGVLQDDGEKFIHIDSATQRVAAEAELVITLKGI